MNLGPNAVNNTFSFLLNQSGSSITLGNNSPVNWDAGNVVAKTGTQTISGQKTFLDSLRQGVGTNFNGAFNDIGSGAYFNNFGQSALTNSVGSSAVTNSFGALATSNNFGLSATANNFGSGSNNTFGSGLFSGPVRLRLPSFSGASNQAGQLGEIRTSGSGIYICTGSASGWGRFFVSTF